MSIQQLQEKLDRHLAYLEQDKNNSHLLLSTGLLKAQILHHQQKITDAIMLLEQLFLEHQSSAEITGLLSLLHFDNQDAVKAESFSKKALALNSSNYEAQLVQILLKALQNNATLDEINNLIEIKPLDSRLWFVLGTTQMRHMNFPAAEQAFLQTTTLFPNFYDSWICAGWCHLLQNNLDKAILSYQQAINIEPETADGFAGLSLVHALQNNIIEAKKKLQISESLDSECFLAAVSRIIIANQSNPEEAAKQFNKTFPSVAPEINRILNLAMLTTCTDQKTMH